MKQPPTDAVLYTLYKAAYYQQLCFDDTSEGLPTPFDLFQWGYQHKKKTLNNVQLHKGASKCCGLYHFHWGRWLVHLAHSSSGQMTPRLSVWC